MNGTISNGHIPGRSLSVKKSKKMVLVPNLKKIPTTDQLHQQYDHGHHNNNGHHGFQEDEDELAITPTHHVHFPLTARTSRISGVAEILRKSSSKKAERVKLGDRIKCTATTTGNDNNGNVTGLFEKNGAGRSSSSRNKEDKIKTKESKKDKPIKKKERDKGYCEVEVVPPHKHASSSSSSFKTTKLARSLGFLGRTTSTTTNNTHSDESKTHLSVKHSKSSRTTEQEQEQNSFSYRKSNGHIQLQHGSPLITSHGNGTTTNSPPPAGIRTTITNNNNSPNCIVVKDRVIIPIPKKKCRPQSYAESPRKTRGSGDRPLSFAEPSPASRTRIVHQHQMQQGLYHHHHNHIHHQQQNLSQSFHLHQVHRSQCQKLQMMQMQNNTVDNNNSFNSNNNAVNTNGSKTNINSAAVAAISFNSNFSNFSNIIQSQNYRIAELEARLSKLRVQQMNKRKSVDFAISCVEPDPIYFSVGQEQQQQRGRIDEAAGQEKLGIYIKSVVKSGSADLDGRLATGDQLLTVDGQSLVGITQEEAAKYLVKTGPIVTLTVGKQAAVYQGIASMLNQPSPETSRGGFNASRRMSERDLPSKVEFTDPSGNGHYPPGHPLNQTRIQSSKSVPVLNDHQPQPNTVPPMVRSPGHPGSVPYGHHNNDPHHSPQRSYAHHYPSASMTMHPSSKVGGVMPGMMNNNDPHHPRSRSIQSLTDPPYRPDMVHKQPSTPALHQQSEEPERFYQNVGFYPPPPPSHPANVPVRTYIPYSSSTGNISTSSASGFRSPVGQHQQPMQYYPPGGSNGPTHPNYPVGARPPPPNLNSSVPGNLNWARNQQQQQQQQQPGVNRDLLRQEAKMLEMQDELRRREERAAIMMSKAQQQNYPTSRYAPQQQQQALRPMYSQQQQQHQRPLSSSGPPPPMAPNKPYNKTGGEFDQPQFSASMGEIPKGAFSYNNGHIPAKAPGVGGANPWDREAKEVEAVRKKEAAKYWRDQQIIELESLLNRSPSQDEQLRALKLEREFQRRAEEMKKDDENGENEEEEEEQNERKAMIRRLQEDLDRTRISGGTNGSGKLEPMEEERSRKIEEMKRKKMELEAAQAAEERLVREAAKRREEELKRQMQQHSFPYQSPYRTSFPPKQLGSPVSSSNSSYPMENHHHQPPQHFHLSPTTAAAPPLPKSPPPTLYRPAPPVSSSPDNKITPPQTSPRPRSDKKTVSFNETVATNEPPPTPPEPKEPVEKVREDPNKFFTEATAMLSSPRSPDAVTPGTGTTPGVIGAQEVYRDPRMRRLAEQQQKLQAPTPKPEKLTFKQKMKMFAETTGEVETPKDKVKTSKAQREIETPAPAANN